MTDLPTFLRNLILFWLVLYMIGILIGRKRVKHFKVGFFYLEISTDPKLLSRPIGIISRLIGPLYKLSIALTVVLSIASSIYLVKITIDSLFGPKVTQIVPVIPGVTLDITVPSLLSIFIVLLAHEVLGHAVMSYRFEVPVRKIAFFILFFLLGAFVEPDEESLRKLNHFKKMGIYSAGIFSNFITFLVFLMITILIFPGFSLDSSSAKPSGVYVDKVFEGGPSRGLIPEGVVIKAIDGYSVRDLGSLSEALRKFKPGDEVYIVTDRGTFKVRLGSRPDDPRLPYLGVQLSPIPYFDPSIPMLSGISIQLLEFLLLTMIFSIGLAAINSLPILPLDGGLVLSEILSFYVDDKLARKLTWTISAPFALILIYNALLFFLG
jgi:membrane-associated protease RseP (regulator of RpoE activity)